MLNQILSRKRRNSFVKGTGTFKGYLWGCGGNLPHTGACPAKEKICHYCYKPNHFISMCRKLKKKENVHGVSKEVIMLQVFLHNMIPQLRMNTATV